MGFRELAKTITLLLAPSGPQRIPHFMKPSAKRANPYGRAKYRKGFLRNDSSESFPSHYVCLGSAGRIRYSRSR